ncbi:MAG: hypothetical protein AB7F66_00330 [Bacteriovoracia bacterium]
MKRNSKWKSVLHQADDAADQRLLQALAGELKKSAPRATPRTYSRRAWLQLSGGAGLALAAAALYFWLPGNRRRTEVTPGETPAPPPMAHAEIQKALRENPEIASFNPELETKAELLLNLDLLRDYDALKRWKG